MVRGIASGVAAGAVWGLVFLAPQVLGDFSPFQLSAARYLAYGAVAMLLLAPRWRGFPAGAKKSAPLVLWFATRCRTFICARHRPGPIPEPAPIRS